MGFGSRIMREKPLILIVDDDRDFQEVLATKFKASGFDVVLASDGEESISKTKEAKPDVILMDVKMPKMDGITAMLKIKEDASAKGIKIILLTAFGDPQPDTYKFDKKLAEDLGAVEYMLKSEDLSKIVERVKSLSSNSQNH